MLDSEWMCGCVAVWCTQHNAVGACSCCELLQMAGQWESECLWQRMVCAGCCVLVYACDVLPVAVWCVCLCVCVCVCVCVMLVVLLLLHSQLHTQPQHADTHTLARVDGSQSRTSGAVTNVVLQATR